MLPKTVKGGLLGHHVKRNQKAIKHKLIDRTSGFCHIRSHVYLTVCFEECFMKIYVVQVDLPFQYPRLV